MIVKLSIFAGMQRVAVIGVVLALATAMLGVTAAVAQAPPTPFDCPTDGILTQAAALGDPSEVRFVDMGSGNVTDGPTLSSRVNAIGYNIHDDLVYGIDMLNGGLIRFGANGDLETVPTPAQLNARTPIGDVDENGHYWTILNNNEWMEIDLSVDPPAFVDSGPITGDGIETYRPLVDWSYVPGTNSLYTVAQPTNDSEAVLFRFDRDSKDFHHIADLGDLGGFGATYADPDGFLYAGNNQTGVIWQINAQSGAHGQFADGPSASLNDGARCFTAPIPVDFGDAPDSYGTLVESGGARHSVVGFDVDSNTAALMVGPDVSIEPDGQPGADADADTFEDGVAEPITTTVGEPVTVTVSVTNDTDEQATLVGWIDVDGSGTFDTGDRSNVLTIPASSGTQPYELTFPAVTTTDDTYARFRVYSEAVNDPSPVGAALGGGVEDYLVHVYRPAIGLNKSADTDELVAGETITYTFAATNSGDEPLDDVAITDTAFSGAGELSDLVCDQPTSLDPEQTLTCTATYEVQQADVDAEFISNEADVVGTGAFTGAGVDDQAHARVPSEFAPAIELNKSASPTTAAVGETITYTFAATNTGDITLSDVEITDTDFSGAGNLSNLDCDQDQPATLTPGETLECTATYVVRQADANTGRLTNIATVTGDTPDGGSVSDNVEVSVTTRHRLANTGRRLPPVALLAAALLAGGALVTRLRRPQAP